MRTLHEYLELPYVIYVVPDETTEGEFCYRSEHPELPGCMSHGSTPQDAIDNLAEAKRLYIESLLELGQPIPLPEQNPESEQPRMIWQIIESSPYDQLEEEDQASKEWEDDRLPKSATR